MVFSFLVTIKLRAATDISQFIEIFEPLRLHSNNNEPNTLTYELLRDTSDDRTLLILERYTSEHDLKVVHCSTEQYKTFLAVVGESGIVESVSDKSFSSELLSLGQQDAAYKATATSA
jgi:quinol monooxygenase YgiN